MKILYFKNQHEAAIMPAAIAELSAWMIDQKVIVNSFRAKEIAGHHNKILIHLIPLVLNIIRHPRNKPKIIEFHSKINGLQ